VLVLNISTVVKFKVVLPKRESVKSLHLILIGHTNYLKETTIPESMGHVTL